MYSYQAVVVRWVDGDTVILRVDLGFRLSFTDAFRLVRVDTPERGQAGWVEATAGASRLAPVGSVVSIRTYKSDKYGRWLADIYPDGSTVSVSTSLLAFGHAVPYSDRATRSVSNEGNT